MAESKCPESLRYQQMQMKRVYGLHSKLVDVLENGDASSKRWIHRMLSLNIMGIFEKTDNERKNITEGKTQTILQYISFIAIPSHIIYPLCDFYGEII